MFYLGAKGMCKTMFLHFVPVDGVYSTFHKIVGGKDMFIYVFMYLCSGFSQN